MTKTKGAMGTMGKNKKRKHTKKKKIPKKRVTKPKKYIKIPKKKRDIFRNIN